MNERWHIVEAQGRVLQVCRTERRARRAQAKWHNLWIWHGGPRTTIRRVAIRNED